MQKIPLHVQTLFAELVEQCLAESGPTGSLYERKIKGEHYTYLKARAGVTRQDVYIGKSGAEQTVAAKNLVEQANALRRTRRQLVQTLKRHLPSPLQDTAKVIDVLAWGGVLDDAVLVGTNAYMCYPALVGYALESAAMGTGDADIAAVNLAVGTDREGYNFLKLLQMADPTFKAVVSLSKSALPCQFKSKSGYRVDLITQARSSRSERALPLPNLQAGAVPLQHVAWLVENPAQAVMLSGSGLLVKIPQPARFAVHKLIVAQKRRASERLKRQKDLVQAGSLIAALKQSDPDSLNDTFEDACSQGKSGWAMQIKKSLSELGLKID